MALATGMVLASPLAYAVDSDGDGLPDDWELTHSGTFAAWPPALDQTLLPYLTAPGAFLLNNDTSSAVTYTATLSNNTVPLYSAVDSISGGVTYAWDEISATGTLLPTISNADDDSEPVAITGFTFPFYGTAYSQVYVSSNGLLSFGYGNNSPGNSQIPGPGAPQNAIAAFWDDLDTRTTGTVYYKQEASRLIIQFQSVGRYSGTGSYTFQAVLHSSGKIELRYKTMTGLLNSASIGVEGADSTMGYGVVHNAAYVTNSLALRFDPTSKFFNIPTLAGSVPAHTLGSLSGLFYSLSLPPGVYTAHVSITHTGTGPSPLALTANLTVPDQPGSISITSPATGATAMQGNTVLIETTATDPDGLDRVEFYDGMTKLGESAAYPGNNYYDFNWYVNENGSRSITAKAIDFFGGVTLSAPVLVNAAANNDFDGMPDSWEIENYLDPNDPYDGEIDADTDGYTNLEEYQFGTNPQLAEDSDFDGMPDGWEYHHGTDINVADSGLDADQDGLTNLDEYYYGTNPRSFDTDGDLLPDLYEIENWLDPLVASGEDDGDLDGLTNLEEYLNKSDPNNSDSDGDGVTDGIEVGQGSDPNNPADGGNPPPDPLESVEFVVGGDYASWRMEIKSLGPRDTRTLLVISPAPNQWETKSHQLWKNNKYEITMHHTGSRPQDNPPWYCWEGQIDSKPGVGTFPAVEDYQLGPRNADGKYFMLKDHWVVDNVDGLLTSHLHSKGVNNVSGKKAILAPVVTEVNETNVAEDDLVAVSLGTDEDLATDFSVKVSGISGLTASLSLKDSDGNLKFKDVNLALADGVKSKTKLWGITPSSARDKTFIKTTIKKDTQVIGSVEEDVTVFKGVEINFDGIFGVPIDSVQEGWRPGALYSDAQAIINLDVQDYSSRISFYDGDQNGLALRSHSPKPNVKVKSAKTLQPVVTLFGSSSPTIDAEISSAQIWFKQGRFEPTGVIGGPSDPSGMERILGAHLEFKKPGGSIFEITSTSDTSRITLGADNTPLPIVAEIASAAATNPLAKWLHEYQGGDSSNPTPRQPAIPAGGPSSIAAFLQNALSVASAKYSNDFFAGTKAARTSYSLTAKGLLGAKEIGNKIEFQVTFERWNGWTLTGEANEGKLINK